MDDGGGGVSFSPRAISKECGQQAKKKKTYQSILYHISHFSALVLPETLTYLDRFISNVDHPCAKFNPDG
jgi:hypothetical protein